MKIWKLFGIGLLFLSVFSFNVCAETAYNDEWNNIDGVITRIDKSYDETLEYLSKDEASESLKDQMKSRNTSVDLHIVTTEEPTEEFGISLYNEAIKHTGLPTEGDYIKFNVSKCSFTMNYSYDTDGATVLIDLSYDIGYYASAEQELETDQEVSKIITELNLTDKNEYEKISIVYDYVRHNVNYDYTHYDDPEYTLKFSSYAAIVKRFAVCQGYATMLYRLLLEAGIDNRIIAGTSEGESHSWNIVELENKYYYLDSTWDSKQCIRFYFLRGRASFIDTHEADESFLDILGQLNISVDDYEEATTCVIENTDGVIAGGKCGGNLAWKLEENGSITISGSGPMYGYPWDSYRDIITDISIEEGVTSIFPLAFAKCPITEIAFPESLNQIGSHAFWQCKHIEEIVIPDNIESIQREAFKECSSLQKVEVDCKSLGPQVFFQCEKLEKAILGTSVVLVGDEAFALCEKLRTVTLSNSIKTIGKSAFSYSNIESIVLPTSLEIINDSAFFCCESLSSIVFGNSIKELGESAFFRTGIKEVSFPDSLEKIGSGCFSQCYSLNAITLNENLTEIGSYAFQYCPITELIIPENVTFIGEGFIFGCTELESLIVAPNNKNYHSIENVIYDANYEVILFCAQKISGAITIPGNVKTIRKNCFSNCECIEKVTLNDGVVILEDGCFQCCTNLKEVILPESLIEIREGAFVGCSSLKHINLTGSIEIIGDGAFRACDSLEEAVIPSSVLEIGDTIFAACKNIDKYIVAENNPNFCSVDGVLYDKSIETLISCPQGKEEVIIPDTVKSIFRRAFYKCNLKEISIPGTVKNIGYEAFIDCTYLEKVHFEEGIEIISGSAFRDCRMLKDVVLPSTLLEIQDDAFSFCRSLQMITIPENVYEIGGAAFSYCERLWDIKLNNNITHIGENAFYDTLFYQIQSNWNNHVLYLDNWILCSDGNITGEYYLPENTHMADYAFSNNEYLTGINIPEGTKSISKGCFQGCTRLSAVIIPDGVERIEESAFQIRNTIDDQVDPRRITLPQSINYIGNSAFALTAHLDLIFTGEAPKFEEKAFWNQAPFLNIYYPSDDNTWSDVIGKPYGDLNDGAYIAWLPYDEHIHHLTASDVKEPTCSSKGEILYKCDCGYEYTVELNSVDHHFVSELINKYPSCEESGSQTCKCRYCGEEKTIEIPATGHSYTFTLIPPTCTEDGYEFYLCECCGHSYKQSYMGPLGHSLEVQGSVEATCSHEGFTGDNVCTVCGEIVIPGEVIEKTPHNYGDWKVTKEATCTETGLKESICSECGDKKMDTIPLADHTWNNAYTVDKEPTCSEEGSESIHCSKCGAIQEGSSRPIEKKEHTWDEGTVTQQPAGNKPGIKTFTCTVCGDTKTEDIPATGIHNYVGTVTKEPTCTETGIKTYTCTDEDCTAAYTEEIPALGHTWNETYTEDKEATCTEEGYESIHCSVCDAVKEGSSRAIEKKDHTYGDWTVTKEATCTETGSKEKVCSACGDKVKETIAAKGHTWNEIYTVDKEATCTEEGSESIHCSICNAIKEGSSRTIDKKEHTYGVWSVIKEATCTETGTKERICSVCNGIETETIPANGHTWNEDYSVDKAPTCTEEGNKSIHCKNCDATKDVTSIPAKGHSFTNYVSNGDAACEKDGTKTAKCDHGCGATDTMVDEGSALRHVTGDPKIENKIEATCTENGSYDEITWCRVCGKELFRETKIIEATDHSAGAPVKENEVAATYLADGSYDSVVYCSVCGKELSRETIMVPKLTAKDQTITVAKTAYNFIFNSSKVQSQAVSVSGAVGDLSYTSSKNSYIYGKDGKIFVARSAPAGTYSVKISATATEDGEYNASNTITVTVKVAKAANTIKVTPASKTFKVAKLKKKAQSFQIKVTQAQGKVTYKSSNKKVKVTVAGKVTVKKGTKKGKYKITVTAAGNGNYNKGVKTVMIVVK